MKKQTVFIVMAQTDYEGSDPVRAFLDKAEAEAFAAKCDAHQRKEPQAPKTIEDTPENDAEHEAFWAKRQRWAKRHPAGEGSATCDSFQVIGIPLVTANSEVRALQEDKSSNNCTGRCHYDSEISSR